MKNLITIAVATLLAAVAFQGRAIDLNMAHDDVNYTSLAAPADTSFTANGHNVDWRSPALIPTPVPEPSAWTFLVASAFAFCLLKDRVKPS